jgi:hypothetical protein
VEELCYVVDSRVNILLIPELIFSKIQVEGRRIPAVFDRFSTPGLLSL